jgi:hypothetical protein
MLYSPRRTTLKATAKSNAFIAPSSNRQSGQKTPLTIEDTKRITKAFTAYYNHARPHGAIYYIAPNERLANLHQSIFQQLDPKLEAAREFANIKVNNSPPQ